MNCDCHGEPAYWHRDPRGTKGGYWRCGVRKRELERARIAINDARRERQLGYWHREGGGYVRRRARHLRQQRQFVTERLGHLQEEANRLA